MFYSTLRFKVDVYFQDVFESNCAEHKFLGFMPQHFVADLI